MQLSSIAPPPRSSQLIQPLRILVCPIEVVRGLVKLPFAFLSHWRRAGQKRSDLLTAQRLERSSHFQRLLQDGKRIASGDDHAGRQREGVLEAFDRLSGLALKDQAIAHGLHAQYSDVVLYQDGKHFLFEAVV